MKVSWSTSMPSGGVSFWIFDIFLRQPTLALLSFALFVWSSVYTCLENLILALEFIFEFILKLARFVVLIDFHGAISIFDSLLLLL